MSEAERPFRLQPWRHAVVFLLAFAAVVSRRPDGIFRAQFYAEGGRVWFANAYNLGWWRPLLHPQDGYFQTFPRLGADLALLAPLAFAPLVMNLLAFAVQALPVNILLSSRSAVWGGLGFRAALAAVCVGLPNAAEISMGITESQWMLAFCAFLLLVASPPESRGAKVFDITVLVLCGLTGPFCIFLLPVALAVAWRRGQSNRGEPKLLEWRWAPLSVLGPCCAVQAWGLLVFAPGSRPHAALGASANLFTRILGGNIFLAVLMGHNKYAWTPGTLSLVVCIAAAVLGATIVTACFLKSGFAMKSLLLLSAAIFMASLLASETRPGQGGTVWHILALTAGGARYWFFPSLAFAWAILWCAWRGPRALRTLSMGLACLIALCIPFRWRRPVLPDLHYAQFAEMVQTTRPGTVVNIPENPGGWSVVLVKTANSKPAE